MKILALFALLAALPARAELPPVVDFYAAAAQADGGCLMQNLPSLVETFECTRKAELEVWDRLHMATERRPAYEALYRDMLADARRADTEGESFGVFARKWAGPWKAFYATLDLPTPVATVPAWLRKPTGAEMRAHYPEALKQAKPNGSALLSCFVRADGTVTACKVAKEAPAGYGVGAAAVDISATFRMRPMIVNGVAIDGGAVIIPFNFDKSVFSRFFR